MTTETGASPLHEFLLARIAEDEDSAKRAAFGWGAAWVGVTDDAEEWSTVHADGQRDMVGCEDGDVTHHIARHDPARVLRECEAKRRIVEWYAQYANIPQWTEGPLLPLMALASVYADHPDYRDEWAQ